MLRAWFLVPLVLLASDAVTADVPPLHDGDLVFQTSRSAQSQAVQRATGSPYSHMGLVFLRNGRPWVLEASGTVRYTEFDAWVRRGIGGHFVVKRLRQPVTTDDMARVRAAAERFLGRPYDAAFGWSDARVYCSELAWKAYDRGLHVHVGELAPMRSFRLGDPVVRRALQSRYHGSVPLDEPVISPAAMFDSDALTRVLSR